MKQTLRCNPEEQFRFEGNSVKYRRTDPLTLSNEVDPSEFVSGFERVRKERLIQCRHPHGMTGLDHP
jgi:hypothetical protein